MKKKIVCFGDSNTYGYIPVTALRFPPDVRWTGVLAKELGEDYEIGEEGMCGRTIAIHDPGDVNNVCGMDLLEESLSRHQPVDLVTIMLGTNDVKQRFHASAEQIGKSLEEMIEAAKNLPIWREESEPKILVIAPPTVRDTYKNGAFSESMGPDCLKKFADIPRIYAETAQRQGCSFFDAGKVVQGCDEDGIHITAESHIRLGKALVPVIRTLV